MITLTSADTLKIKLASAVATNELDCVLAFADLNATTFVPGSGSLATTGTTLATLMGSPASGTTRQLKWCSVFNSDTARATVYVLFDSRVILKTVLAIASTLEYLDGEGWRVINTDGELLVTAPTLICNCSGGSTEDTEGYFGSGYFGSGYFGSGYTT